MDENWSTTFSKVVDQLTTFVHNGPDAIAATAAVIPDPHSKESSVPETKGARA